MSISKTYTAQVNFVRSSIISVETDITKGLHSFSVVGMAGKAVDEAKDRISSAIKNTGFKSPKNKNQKVVISLAPADMKKDGSNFDLSFAIGYLLASGDIEADISKTIFIGELSLSGEVKRVKGVLPMIVLAKKEGFKEFFIPKDNADEASLISGVSIFPVESLREVVAHINTKKQSEENGGDKNISSKKIKAITSIPKVLDESIETDFSDIKGQESCKRALEISMAGGHNIVMYGPPGTGKTMLAKASSFVLPNLTEEEMFDVTSIYSIHTGIDDFIKKPPFRSPHHTASYVSLVGGGVNLSPGEVTLAHKGILFLDELPEFDNKVLESLREPLEEGKVRVSRAKGSVYFPANFILIGAMNPCPCGFYGVKGRECICSPAFIDKYRRKLSGPIKDRIDIWVEVSNIEYDKLTEKTETVQSDEMKKRIEKARLFQGSRYKKMGLNIFLNKDLSSRHIINNVILDENTKKILNDSAKAFNLSARSYHRLIKVARTIADLAESENICQEHVLEALQYRPKIYS